MSNTQVSIGEMAKLILDKVLASVFDSDDDSDDFGHLYTESKEEEDGVSAYTCQQQFSLEKLAALSQVISTEPLSSSNSKYSILKYIFNFSFG